MVSYIQGSCYSVRVSHKVHDHLHTFFGLSLMLCSIQFLCIPLTAKSNKLVELRGIISKTVVLSTYFNRECQSPSSLLIPVGHHHGCGAMETGKYRLSPLGFVWSEKLLSRHTVSDRHSKNIVLEAGCYDRLYRTLLKSRQKICEHSTFWGQLPRVSIA